MSTFLDSPHQFEPLMPSDMKLEPLLALAHELTVQSAGLGGFTVPKGCRSMFRAMNAYYASKIDAQHIPPSEIARALRGEFSKDETLATKQRLAVSHILAEEKLEGMFEVHRGGGELYSKDTLLGIHRELFDGLPDTNMVPDHGVAFVPGAFRTAEVSRGIHMAPAASRLLKYCSAKRLSQSA